MIEFQADPAALRFRKTSEVAARCKIDTDIVRRDLRKGVIQATRLGRDYLFTLDQFQAAIAFYRAKAREKRNAARTRRARPVTDS